ncbi:MAG TPA: RHS repeat domain-containing protein [Pseudobacteroides sp.]|uniref:RHS repeat domain-containing protein n=1 Tax=Pseudobacteroides sp. TaxID=1968840 RepID=UPI002F94D769
MKYVYTRTNYSTAGKPLTVYTLNDGDGVLLSDTYYDTNNYPTKPDGTSLNYSITQFAYHINGKIGTQTEGIGPASGIASDSKKRVSEFDYDEEGNICSDIARDYHGATLKTTNKTKYFHSYIDKPNYKKVQVNLSDIYGNSTTATGLTYIFTSYKYDKNGNLASEIDANSNTDYQYNSLNMPTIITQNCKDASGNSVISKTETIYNWEGKPVYFKDALNNETVYDYDERGFVKTVSLKNVKRFKIEDGTESMEDEITAYDYDLAGRKTKEVKPENYNKDLGTDLGVMNHLFYEYDSMGRIIATGYKGKEYKLNSTGDGFDQVDSKIYYKAFDHDTDGNVVKELDSIRFDKALGTTTKEKIQSGIGREFTYTPADKILTVTEPELVGKDKNSKTCIYDTLGRIVKETRISGTIAAPVYYDTIYEYDDKQRSVKTSVNTGTETVLVDNEVYDYTGNVIQDVINIRKDANNNFITNVVNYEYNLFNQLRKVTYPEDPETTKTILSYSETYQYDEYGQVKMKLGSNSIVDVYSYNGLGNVVEVKHGKMTSYTNGAVFDTATETKQSFEYDLNGNLIKSTDANGNATNYSYDEANRLKTTFMEDVFGNVASGNDNFGRKVNHLSKNYYDRNNNVVMVEENVIETIDNYSNTLVKKMKFDYDPMDRMIRRSAVLGSYEKDIQLLEYNHNNQQFLSSEAPNEDTLSNPENNGGYRISKFIYDEYSGDLLRKFDPNHYGEDDDYNHGTTFEYDLAGNMTGKIDGRGNKITYNYNAFNMLVRVTMPTEGTQTYSTAYAYDYNGNIIKQTNEKLVNSVWTPHNIISEYEYNVRNLPKVRKDGAGVSETYKYYSDGLISDKTNRKGQTLKYEYDVNNSVDCQVKLTPFLKFLHLKLTL